MKHADKDSAIRRLAAQHAAAEAVAASREPREAAARVLEGICRSLGWKQGAYWELDGGVLRCSSFWRQPSTPDQMEAASCGLSLTLGQDLPGRTLEQARPVWIPDYGAEKDMPRSAAAAQTGLRCAFGVPVLVKDRPEGVLEFFNDETESPDGKLLISLASVGVSLGLMIERTRAQESLAASRAWIQLLLDSTAEGIISVDIDGRCVLVNPAALKMLGLEKAEQLLDRPLHDAVRHAKVGSSPCPGEGCMLRAAFYDGNRYHSDNEEFRRSDGSYFPVEYWSHPLVQGGQCVGAVMTFLDISERRESERAVLEAANLKASFVSMVAHEVRSPLSAVKMALDMVQDGTVGPLNTEQQRLLDTSKKSVDRLVRMVTNVLDYQKMDMGKLDFTFAKRDLWEQAREAAETFSVTARDKGLKLETSLPKGTGETALDADRIAQVLANLLSNAVKFTDRGTIAVTGRREDDGSLTLSVKDDGIGIARDDLSKLFTTFTQLKTGRESGGSGLGLAVAKRIIEAHGGRIWAESTPGKGTTFAFSLPAR